MVDLSPIEWESGSPGGNVKGLSKEVGEGRQNVAGLRRHLTSELAAPQALCRLPLAAAIFLDNATHHL